VLALDLEGESALADQLAGLPDALRAALAEKVGSLAQDLYEQVTGANLSGDVLNARSGRLRDSIQIQQHAGDGRTGADIFADGSVPYAAIQEFGGKTAAHEILPNKSRSLAFLMNGKQIFSRRVEHPGSVIPARSYLRSALSDQSDEIVQDLAQVAISIAVTLEDSP